uniref:Uncharacterized protein n=1 Tax=Eutreptiella gymnastica TaxID=73025 RepID=A0A7S1HUH7_9EUGL|mmetsp:Transcript_106675/g.183983  ORF Transcript_106675/g.183983 Transcript_106675/m.183983 type:complete len:263 (+) Transcript_106675:58-846(+)
MPYSLLWDKLQATDVAALTELKEQAKVRVYLEEFFARSPPSWLYADDADANAGSKNDILLEFFFHTLRFCWEHQFDCEKTSTLFSIMYWTHSQSMAGRATAAEGSKILQNHLVHHSIHRPPFSEAIFTNADLQAITQYAADTYFRHYTAYLYAFTPLQLLTATSIYGRHNTERPPPPKPLAQSLTEKEWRSLCKERDRRAAEQEAQRQARLEAEALANAPAPGELLLANQLGNIKGMLATMTTHSIQDLEAKIDALAAQVGV